MHKVCPLSAYKKPEFLTELPKSPSLAESLAGQGQQKEPGLGSGTKLVIARLRPGHIPSLRWEGLLASCSAAGRTGGGQVSLWPRKIHCLQPKGLRRELKWSRVLRAVISWLGLGLGATPSVPSVLEVKPWVQQREVGK